MIIVNGKVTRTKECCLPVGLLADAQFESGRLELTPGSRVVLVTDGVTEAEDVAGEFFGDARLEKAAEDSSPFDKIFASVREFCGTNPLNDDCTILELNYKG